MPKVTVLMSVYNAERYLKESIQSILNQTWMDFEFLIINDGSTDGSRDIITSFDDKRIRLDDNPGNIGLAKSLNHGLRIASGDLIARQDADDVSLPFRLKRQISSFKPGSNIALLGAWAFAIDEKGTPLWEIRTPTDPSLLKWRMLFKNHIIHSSVMFDKAKVLEIGGYNPEIRRAQDYDLWSRLLRRYDIYQLPEILIYLRDHSENITARDLPEQKEMERLSVHRNIEFFLNKRITLEDAYDLGTVLENRPVKSAEQLKRTCCLLQDLYLSFIKRFEPDLKDKEIVTRDYAKMLKTIALKHANFCRRGTLSILNKALMIDKSSIIDRSTMKCILKVLVGPNLIPKCRHLSTPS